MKGLVAQWLEQERAALEAEPVHAYFTSIHIDDLLGGEPREGNLVALGVDALLLCHEMVSRSTHLLPRLAITLMSSSTLDTELPDLDRLESLRDGMVPPELYVFRRNLEYLTGGHEEYRAAYIDVDLARRHDVPPMEAHYTTYRDEISRRNGWDYSRTVWFNLGAHRSCTSMRTSSRRSSTNRRRV